MGSCRGAVIGEAIQHIVEKIRYVYDAEDLAIFNHKGNSKTYRNGAIRHGTYLHTNGGKTEEKKSKSQNYREMAGGGCGYLL